MKRSPQFAILTFGCLLVGLGFAVADEWATTAAFFALAVLNHQIWMDNE